MKESRKHLATAGIIAVPIVVIVLALSTNFFKFFLSLLGFEVDTI